MGSLAEDGKDIAVRIFEPDDLHLAGYVHIAATLGLWHVVMLEDHAFVLQRRYDSFDAALCIAVDHPGRGRCLVAAGIL
jgi:hypothetical protein